MEGKYETERNPHLLEAPMEATKRKPGRSPSNEPLMKRAIAVCLREPEYTALKEQSRHLDMSMSALVRGCVKAALNGGQPFAFVNRGAPADAS
jgi:hypothetical protein